MLLHELRDELKANGWLISTTPYVKKTGVGWYAWKPMGEDVPDCVNNEKKPVIAIWPWRIDHEIRVWESVEVELTAASALDGGEQWWELKAYSVKPNELLARLPVIERALAAAWRAIAE